MNSKNRTNFKKKEVLKSVTIWFTEGFECVLIINIPIIAI